MNKFQIYFENLLRFQKTVKNFQIYKPDLVITNITRGKEGSYNCLAEEKKSLHYAYLMVLYRRIIINMIKFIKNIFLRLCFTKM